MSATDSPRSEPRQPASLAAYDSALYGPLFAVSDEGSAGEIIVEAAYASAKASALHPIDIQTLGVALDGERMTSAGEVPIGPAEYAELSEAAAGKLFLTTNVGVRANARLTQHSPAIPLTAESAGDQSLLENAASQFSQYLHTLGGQPRPLGIYLEIDPEAPLFSLEPLAEKLEAIRAEGRIGPAAVHRFAILLSFKEALAGEERLQIVEKAIGLAAAAGFREVVLDAPLHKSARDHLSVQSLLNILSVGDLSRLLAAARSCKVQLAYRYRLDIETAARTIWTGLHAARTQGFSAGKYGLVPMTLEEQAQVIGLIGTWVPDWCAIPAFYVDTPLLTASEVYPIEQCKEAAKVWLKMARGAGATLVLFDCPDRYGVSRKLVRDSAAANDPGILTLQEIAELIAYAGELGVSILWSGGISARQAFELAKLQAAGIFSTSSTAAKIAVTADFERDPRLPAENEPTEFGVRRIHAIIQSGFLAAKLGSSHPELAKSLEAAGERLLGAEKDLALSCTELKTLNAELVRGWQALFAAPSQPAGAGFSRPSVPVPSNSVRVFRGRKKESLGHAPFVQKLGQVFMPLTVQMQRQYGLTAYLPAVLPEKKPAGLPDEVALVFYRTQESYDFAKRCIGGRAYSDLHQLVFEMEKSPSGFPELFGGTAQPDKAYCLFLKSIDWQTGSTRLFVGTARDEAGPEGFFQGLSGIAAAIQADPDGLDGVVFSTGPNWLVWWEHSPECRPDAPSRFAEIAAETYAAVARPVRIPASLLRPYAGLSLGSNGDFVNFVFPRL